MAPYQVKERPSDATQADSTQEQGNHYVVQRIRDSLNWLRRTPTRTSAPYQKAERHIRDSIRQLSRQG